MQSYSRGFRIYDYFSMSEIPTVILTVILIVLLIFLFVLFLQIFFWRKRSEFVNSFLENGDFSRFIFEIEKDIGSVKQENMKAILSINKSAGLVYLGEAKEAERLLLSLKPEILPKLAKHLYYNNLLSIQLHLKKFDEAKSLLEEQREWFFNATGSPQFDQAIEVTLATYELFLGDISKSKQTYLKILSLKRPKTYQAMVNYHLGIIAIKENDVNLANDYFDKTIELGPSTFLPEKIKNMRSDGFLSI